MDAYDELRARPVASWTTGDVQELLVHLDLQNQLGPIFKKNAVNGRDLQGFSIQGQKDELGCTELQARKIIITIDALTVVGVPAQVPPSPRLAGAPPPAHPQAAYGYAPAPAPVVVPQAAYVYAPASAPVVVHGGYTYYPRERYIGGISWVIAVCFCFPCIFFCPVDERPVTVVAAQPVVVQPVAPPAAQSMRS